MDMGLNGRTVIVTGATGGLGGPIARRFAAEGANVAMTYHDSSPPETGKGTMAVHYELGDQESARALVEEVLARFGRIDVLVNNAVRWNAPDPDDWQRVLRDNIEGAVMVSRLVAPLMQKRGWGRLVHISSGIATQGMAGGEHYGAAKAALHGYSRSLAFTLGRSGDILSNVVAPGLTVTDRNTHIVESAPDHFTDKIPLGRLLTADEVAAPVVFLASAANTGITGQVVAVDGGV